MILALAGMIWGDLFNLEQRLRISLKDFLDPVLLELSEALCFLCRCLIHSEPFWKGRDIPGQTRKHQAGDRHVSLFVSLCPTREKACFP